MASGNVAVPIFTTMNPESAQYVAQFAGIDMLILGAAGNWEKVRDSFPPDVPMVKLPGAPKVEGAPPFAIGDGIEATTQMLVQHHQRVPGPS